MSSIPPSGTSQQHLGDDTYLFDLQQGYIGAAPPPETEWESQNLPANNPSRSQFQQDIPLGGWASHLTVANSNLQTLSEAGFTENTFPTPSEHPSESGTNAVAGPSNQGGADRTKPQVPFAPKRSNTLFDRVAPFFMFARLLKLGGFFPNTTRYPDQKLEEEAATAYAGYVANRTNSQTDTALVKRIAGAAGQIFRNRANKHAALAFRLYYLHSLVPPGASVDPANISDRLQLIANLVNLKTNHAYLHWPSPVASEIQFFNNPFFLYSLNKYFWFDPLLANSIPEYYEGFPLPEYLMGLWGACIVYQIDLYIAYLIGIPVPKFDDYYHTHSDDIAIQVQICLNHPTKGAAYRLLLTQWSYEIHAPAIEASPGPINAARRAAMLDLDAVPAPKHMWHITPGTGFYPILAAGAVPLPAALTPAPAVTPVPVIAIFPVVDGDASV